MHNILTPQEFIDQGMTAGTVISIARFNRNYGHLFNSPANLALADRLTAIAHEVGRITGKPLRAAHAANDNGKARKQAASKRRRAA